MKTKLTLQQKEAKRTYKVPNKFIWKLLYNLGLKTFCQKPYRPVTVTIKDKIQDGPAFLVYNHQSRGDYVWIAEACYPRPINFMVNYAEFFRSHLAFILHFLNAIPKKMFNQDLPSMRAVDTIIKKGGIVAFAPDGTSSITGHNQPIVPGTGNYLKHYQVPVYNLKIRGGFLSDHKCCLETRTGKVDAELSLLFSKEDLINKTAEEIHETLQKELWNDDYEWQKTEHVKWKTNGAICKYMHDLCYKCPTCGEELQMIGEGNTLKCKKCGAGATMDDYYTFHPFEGSNIPESPSKWVDWERRIVAKEIRADENYSFTFHTTLGIQPPYKTVKGKLISSVPVGEGDITIDHKGLHYRGTKEGQNFDFDLDYGTIYTVAINTDCKAFAVYYKGQYIEFVPNVPIVGKVLLAVEELSRLHFNKWPNFPWFDYDEEIKFIK